MIASTGGADRGCQNQEWKQLNFSSLPERILEYMPGLGSRIQLTASIRKPPLKTNALLLMPRVLLNPVVRMTARQMSRTLEESLSNICLLGER